MEYTLVLKVPEEVYEPLAKKAALAKQNPEEMVIHWLTIAARQFKDDPLEKFIGAFKSPVHDWVDQHDKYIAQAVMASHDEDPNGA